jgi:hypothetical protein
MPPNLITEIIPYPCPFPHLFPHYFEKNGPSKNQKRVDPIRQ